MILKDKVLNYLLLIPKWKVTTYKNLAIKFDTHPRTIASIMKNNKEPYKFPCYKVVFSSWLIWWYNTERWIEEKIEKLKNDWISLINWKIPQEFII